jgi:hypothetical protein
MRWIGRHPASLSSRAEPSPPARHQRHGVSVSTIPTKNPSHPASQSLRSGPAQPAADGADLNSQDRDMTVLRMHRGKRRKQQRGGFLGGTPRYGYHTADKELVPDRAEQAIARHIRRMHRDGYSIRAITATLNAEGVPAKRGGQWHPATVARVLQGEP